MGTSAFWGEESAGRDRSIAKGLMLDKIAKLPGRLPHTSTVFAFCLANRADAIVKSRQPCHHLKPRFLASLPVNLLL